MGGVGSEGRNPATRFVTFGDVIETTPDKLSARAKQTMDAVQRTLSLANQPVISVSATQKLDKALENVRRSIGIGPQPPRRAHLARPNPRRPRQTRQSHPSLQTGLATRPDDPVGRKG